MDSNWHEKWEAERREYLRVHGIDPPDPHRGRVRVLGAYALPYCPATCLLEVLIHEAPDHVDFSTWWPYKPPAWDEEWQVGRPHFYFDRRGEELIGSYLSRPRLEPIWRAGLLLFDEPGVLIQDEMYWIRETTPVPDRLLRLIWVEDGLPFAGPEQAFGDEETR